MLLSAAATQAQDANAVTDRRVALSETASALDAAGAAALEGTLRTTAINGAPDTPVSNISVVIKNVSRFAFSYVSGVVSFYDSTGVRCGEGLFKVDALAEGESAETDVPGIRIRCAPATWRVVATNLVLRTAPNPAEVMTGNLVISVDGEEHPIQLNRPMVLVVGDTKRTIIVRNN
jgi:hypothetical protein